MTEPNEEVMPASEDAVAPETAASTETSPSPEAEIPPNPAAQAPAANVLEPEAVTTEAAPPATEPVVPTPEAPAAKPDKDDNAPAAPTPVPPTATTATIFPCIEQPLRVTLHCNGYYLWGLRKGKVIARKKRSERDEFRLTYLNEGQIMEITNHKFGGLLSVVVGEEDNSRKVVCIKKEDKEAKEEAKANGATPVPANDATATLDKQVSAISADPEEEEGFEDEPAINDKDLTEEDKQWCFVKGTHGRNEVLLKSLRTGENLGIDAKGNIVFTTSDNPDDNPTTAIAWDIECVTGELCYLSNPVVDSRIRCDIAGLLSLTDSWKGWEVFRLMEAGHGYVKISSWMHSQNLLCSSADGTVTTCSHAESFLEDNPKGCPKWAIEKYSGEGNNNGGAHKGVIIRSKTSGRLLCVHEGGLRTYDPADSEAGSAIASATASQETTTEGKSWWNSGVKSANNTMRNSMKNMQKRFSSAAVKTESGDSIFLPQQDTLVWQLEAAHLQTYYFISAAEGETPRSLGPFPEVTANLRKTEKIQLVREETGITRLVLLEKKQYISCSSEGKIDFVNSAEDASTEWIMDKPSYQAGGSVFRSRIHNLYLSYEDTEEDVETETGSENVDSSEKNQGHFGNLFGGKKEKVGMLLGSEFMGPREVWKLEPCMPRAVSSEKIKTFALGTGIAVGTTIAMPFALAGMGAILGAVGAEVGFVANAIAVGLTGAEALASVGAIGATAYIVFRPEENSLTDDHENDEEEEAERAWSKRPFSNWRNW